MGGCREATQTEPAESPSPEGVAQPRATTRGLCWEEQEWASAEKGLGRLGGGRRAETLWFLIGVAVARVYVLAQAFVSLRRHLCISAPNPPFFALSELDPFQHVLSFPAQW